MKACLLGMGLGDALGFHVEALGAERVDALVNLMESYPPRWFPLSRLREVELTDWITGERYESGQISDDTQMAFLVARAYAHGKGARGLAELLADGFRRAAFAGYGYTTRDAVQNFIDGKPLEACGLASRSNGAAMRVAPLAVLIADDAELAQAAAEQASVTHTHPDSIEAAVALAIGVRAAIEGRGQLISPTEFAERIGVHAPGIGEKLLAMQDLRPRDARAFVLALDRTDTPHQGTHGLSSYAVPCVLWSLYVFLQSPENPWQTLSRAISIGGDTDTVAAMAGALAGVFNGPERLPHWTEGWLHDRGAKPEWDFLNEQRSERYSQPPVRDPGGPERG